MLVHEDVYDDVASKVVEAVRNMPAGDPFAPGTVLSPLVTKAAQERVLSTLQSDRRQRCLHPLRTGLGESAAE